MTLSKKVKDVSKSSVGSAPPTERKDHDFLKKTEPPKWNGDPLDFALGENILERRFIRRSFGFPLLYF